MVSCFIASINIYHVGLCSIIRPQSHHLVVMKMNQEDRDQVLEDQRRRRSTSPAETNTLAKVKMKPMALYHSLDSLAIWRIETSKPCKRTITKSKNVFYQNTQIRIWLLSSLLQCYIFDNSSCIIICWIESCNNVHIINQGLFFSLVYLLNNYIWQQQKGFTGGI